MFTNTVDEQGLELAVSIVQITLVLATVHAMFSLQILGVIPWLAQTLRGCEKS